MMYLQQTSMVLHRITPTSYLSRIPMLVGAMTPRVEAGEHPWSNKVLVGHWNQSLKRKVDKQMPNLVHQISQVRVPCWN